MNGVLTCPHCGHAHGELAQFVDGSPLGLPEAGDVRVCVECAEPALYATDGHGGLTLRSPTAQELAELHSTPQMRAIRAAIAQRGPAARIREVPW